MTLTEILLLVIALGGAFYFGYVFGRRSLVYREPAEGTLPGPETDRVRPAPADVSGAPPRRAPPPPASAGGSAGGTAASAQREVRRTAKPPPARAGLIGSGGSDGNKS